MSWTPPISSSTATSMQPRIEYMEAKKASLDADEIYKQMVDVLIEEAKVRNPGDYAGAENIFQGIPIMETAFAQKIIPQQGNNGDVISNNGTKYLIRDFSGIKQVIPFTKAHIEKFFPFRKDELQNYLNSQDKHIACLMLARAADKIIGYAVAHHDEDAAFMNDHSIMIDPKYSYQKVAKSLMNRMSQKFSQLRIQNLYFYESNSKNLGQCNIDVLRSQNIGFSLTNEQEIGDTLQIILTVKEHPLITKVEASRKPARVATQQKEGRGLAAPVEAPAKPAALPNKWKNRAYNLGLGSLGFFIGSAPGAFATLASSGIAAKYLYWRCKKNAPQEVKPAPAAQPRNWKEQARKLSVVGLGILLATKPEIPLTLATLAGAGKLLYNRCTKSKPKAA